MQFCDHVTYDKDSKKNIVNTYEANEYHICKCCGMILSDYENNIVFGNFTKMLNKEIPYNQRILYKVSRLMTRRY